MEVTEARGCGVARLWGSWRELCLPRVAQGSLGICVWTARERLGLCVKTGLCLEGARVRAQVQVRLRNFLVIFSLPSPLYETDGQWTPYSIDPTTARPVASCAGTV